MALKRISDYTTGTTPMVGTELLEIETAGGVSQKITAQDIADLGSGDAADVAYDNTASGLTADDVQAALDELASNLSHESPCFVYTTDTGSTADSDPGAGLVKWNNATQSSATKLFFDDATADTGTDLSAYFTELVASSTTGILHMVAEDGAFKLYKWTGITDGTGYFKFTVSHLVSSGGNFADGITVRVVFHPMSAGGGGSGSGTVFGGGVAGAGFGAGTDPLIDNVVSLIPFDARNNTVGFVDLCGNPLIDFNKVRGDSSKQQYGKNTMKNEGGGLSVFSARGIGTDKFLNSFVIGTQDFCWEIDFAVSGTLRSFNGLISNRPNNGSTGGTVAVGITSANQLYVYANSGFVVAASAGTAVSSPTAFHKLRYEVVSGTGYLYLDGTRIGSGAQPTVNYTSKLAIGANSDSSETAACNFANFRYTLGANRSAGASSYTPATGQFPFA